MSVGRKDLASFQTPVFLSRYLLGWTVRVRKNLGPASVWTSLSQTATPTPPWQGPHFFSGWRGALAERFALAAMGEFPFGIGDGYDRAQTVLAGWAREGQ